MNGEPFEISKYKSSTGQNVVVFSHFNRVKISEATSDLYFEISNGAIMVNYNMVNIPIQSGILCACKRTQSYHRIMFKTPL